MKKKTIKKVAKFLAMMLMSTMIFSMVSCFGNTKSFPEYEDDREMMIGGWDSPMNTLEDIQIAKDMGLTHMFLDQNHARRGTPEYEAALRLYEQVGLNVIVQTTNAFKNEGALNDNTDYSQFPSVDFINYWDEPYWSSMERVAELYAEHIAKY